MIHRRQMLTAALCAVPLVGCNVFPSPPTPQIYRLSPQSPTASEPPHQRSLRRQLVIDVPTASQSLDTDRIALIHGRTKFDYYAGSLWTDRVPMLVQMLLVEAFESDGGIAHVGRDAQELTPDYLLAAEIRKFEAVYGDTGNRPPMAVIALDLVLVKMPEHRMLARTLIVEQSPASNNSVEGVVEAFDAAAGNLLPRCVTWAISVMRKTG
jgi:cholesterol transport system auxiliary component